MKQKQCSVQQEAVHSLLQNIHMPFQLLHPLCKLVCPSELLVERKAALNQLFSFDDCFICRILHSVVAPHEAQATALAVA